MAYWDSTRSSLAYAERGMPKLRKELSCEDLITRQKALVTMADLMHSTERVHEAVRSGCLIQIIILMCDQDETIRFKSVSVLQTVLQHTVGREAFLKHEGYSHLVTLFKDDSIKIRLRAFQTMQTLTTVPAYARIVASNGLCEKLVAEHLNEVPATVTGESLEVILMVLEIIHQLLFVNASPFGEDPNNNDAKACEKLVAQQKECDLRALTAFTTLIQHEESKIKAGACTAMHDLCANSVVAKTTASTHADIIPCLCSLLQNSCKCVRVAACQAIMTICITTEGKLAAVQNDIVPSIVALIDEALEASTPEQIGKASPEADALNDSLRLYVIRAAQVIAEVPEARHKLCKDVQKIRDLAENMRLSSDVRRAADETISVIMWKP